MVPPSHARKRTKNLRQAKKKFVLFWKPSDVHIEAWMTNDVGTPLNEGCRCGCTDFDFCGNLGSRTGSIYFFIVFFVFLVRAVSC